MIAKHAICVRAKLNHNHKSNFSIFDGFEEGQKTLLKFVGFENYLRLLSDATFRKAAFNTFLYLIVQVPVMIILAMVISVILNDNKLKFRGLYRTAIFLP